MDEAISRLALGIFNATWDGSIGFVQYYGDIKKVNLTWHDELHDTILHPAIAKGHLDIIEYYHQKVGLPTLRRFEELHRAFIYAFLANHPAIMRRLFNAANTEKDFVYKYLAEKGPVGDHASCSHSIVYLIDNNIYIMKENDTNLLLAAARNGDVSFLEYLIFKKHLKARGTDAITGNTALHAAALHNRLEAVQFFKTFQKIPTFSNRNDKIRCRPGDLAR